MSFLAIDVELVRRVWQAVDPLEGASQRAVVPLDDARRDVLKHVPQTCLHGVVCRDCHTAYPCGTAVKAMTALRLHGWDWPDVMVAMDLLGTPQPHPA